MYPLAGVDMVLHIFSRFFILLHITWFAKCFHIATISVYFVKYLMCDINTAGLMNNSKMGLMASLFELILIQM